MAVRKATGMNRMRNSISRSQSIKRWYGVFASRETSCPLRWRHRENLRPPKARLGERLRYGAGEIVCARPERDHATPEPCSREPRAAGAARQRDLDGEVKFGAGNLVIVAKRDVRSHEQVAKCRAVAETTCGFDDALVLGDHVAGAFQKLTG
jgi:hypothetical protein